MNIKKWTLNPFQQNSYVLWDQDGTAIFVDCGYYSSQELEKLYTFISDNKLNPTAIVLTHAHLDHTFGALDISEKYKLQVYMHKGDLDILNTNEKQAAKYGLNPRKAPIDIVFIQETQVLEFGSIKLSISHVPGHSPGSISLYVQSMNSVFTGDVLFKDSIGRTDLPGGNFETLQQSIRTHLYTLPQDTAVYSGHGPETTIGDEAKFNPYVRNY